MPMATPGAEVAPQTMPVPSAPSAGPRTINAAMEEAIAKTQAAKAAAPAPTPSVVKATSDLLTKATTAKLKLTAAEVKTGADLIRAGKTPSQALDAIQAMRTFAQKFNLPASAEVKAVVKERNAAGEWGEKK